jgi:hypothetical protein
MAITRTEDYSLTTHSVVLGGDSLVVSANHKAILPSGRCRRPSTQPDLTNPMSCSLWSSPVRLVDGHWPWTLVSSDISNDVA